MAASHLDYYLPEHEKLVSCPYNKAHQVVKHRMPNHLIKCRRSHSTKGTKECRFDTTHIVPEAEIKYHEANCPGRLTVELYMSTSRNETKREPMTDSGISTAATSMVSLSRQIVSEDDWDTSVHHPTYDPKKVCQRTDVLVHIQHKTPSQRKEAREKERERLKLIRSKDPFGENND